ncbi:MAG: acyl--CoA ligase [Acidobacteriia bacterium]|nr:acyl--CoA ligase [Terriglobia bacterium]
MRSVATVLDAIHVAPAERTAIIIPESGARVTYGSLREQVLTMADTLAAAGIRRGGRVAIALSNGLPAIVSFLAASVAGTAAPMNPTYKYQEFAFYLEDTSARVLICSPKDGEAGPAAADLGIPILPVVLDEKGTVHLQGISPKPWTVAPTADDIALVLHTSGSTGRPKRVPLQHRNLAQSTKSIVQTYALTPDDVSLCFMPLFHVHGIVASTLATLLSGGTVVAPTGVNPLMFWRLVRQYRVTWYTAVPTIHHVVAGRARSNERPSDGGSLRFVRSASAPLAPEMMRKMEEVFGVPVLEAYGMTEAAHQMASNPLPPAPRKAGSVGLPTGLQISIMDALGNHRPQGERAEVVIKGPNVFSGYENNPAENKLAFSNGWFRTGDEGWLDPDGYLHISGRIKELINRAGEKVAPRHVDEVLAEHPAVAEAVAFGMPHPSLGEEVAAAVVLRQGYTEADLLKFCRERLAHFECPKKIFIVESIPRTATGKIQRRIVAQTLCGNKEHVA